MVRVFLLCMSFVVSSRLPNTSPFFQCSVSFIDIVKSLFWIDILLCCILQAVLVVGCLSVLFQAYILFHLLGHQYIGMLS